MKQFWPCSLVLLLFSLFSSSFSFAQASVQPRLVVPEPNTRVDTTWLPRRHSESLGPYLEKIIPHAESRRLCPKLLEARLSEDGPADNPTFIITCKLENYQTVNLIYTRQDVLEEFRNIAYEHKDFVEPEQAQSPLDTIGPTRVDQAKTACKQKVRTNARDGDLATLPDNDAIDIRPRQDNKLAVFVKYHIDQRASALHFTATCVVDENNLVAMEVYAD